MFRNSVKTTAVTVAVAVVVAGSGVSVTQEVAQRKVAEQPVAATAVAKDDIDLLTVKSLSPEVAAALAKYKADRLPHRPMRAGGYIGPSADPVRLAAAYPVIISELRHCMGES